MTTETERIVILNCLLTDAENELAAVLVDLATAHARIDALEAEAASAVVVMGEQQQLIEAHQHASVLAHEAHRRVVAERDALVGRLMGGIWVWEIEGSAN